MRAHVERFPFENISKLYYLSTRRLRGIPDLRLFLDGMEHHGLGGTCYSNNFHLYSLVAFLGYDVALCGADMSQPDVHVVLIVRFEGREYLIDVGYGSPLFEPMPRDLDEDLEVRLGNERWILKPQDEQARSWLEHHRRGELVHGYIAKPRPRKLEFFRSVIENSYRPEATFMTSLRAVCFDSGGSLAISNLTSIRSRGDRCTLTKLADLDELVELIEQRFGIPASITREAAAVVPLFGSCSGPPRPDGGSVSRRGWAL